LSPAGGGSGSTRKKVQEGVDKKKINIHPILKVFLDRSSGPSQRGTKNITVIE